MTAEQGKTKRYTPRKPGGRFLFQKGQPRAPGAGRRKGTGNKMTTAVKEAVVTAMTLYGEDGKGKKGMIGFFLKLCADRPELMVRLAEKILPIEVKGIQGGVVTLMALTPEVLERLDDDQLALLESAYGMLEGTATPEESKGPVVDADPSEYAVLINGDGDG